MEFMQGSRCPSSPVAGIIIIIIVVIVFIIIMVSHMKSHTEEFENYNTQKMPGQFKTQLRKKIENYYLPSKTFTYLLNLTGVGEVTISEDNLFQSLRMAVKHI